ncbi:MAG: Ig-like domain-containing protein, partial [Balneolaceae bacterium]|nr:Ig-like domain-containing protein [Balneolaceae bacterium]
MIQFSSIRIIAGCLLLCLLVISCATPTAPTGGPPDREGPEVLSTEPETGTTNFSGRSIKFSFSEFVKRNTLQQALTIEPDLGIEYSINWGRKSVAIEFEERLPDSTTIIVTLGTDLADVNGNKISSPKKVAVSTGPEIDSGEIYGRVVSARTGRGESGHRILLYRTPADLSTKAIYSAETDTSGRFQFSYLSEGTYKAFWLNDRNRNKIWEPERERAQPFPRDRLELLKGATDTLETLYVANADTTAPNLQGVGLFSSRRLRLRFSENIEWTNRSQVQVQDSLGNRYADAYPLYR